MKLFVRTLLASVLGSTVAQTSPAQTSPPLQLNIVPEVLSGSQWNTYATFPLPTNVMECSKTIRYRYEITTNSRTTLLAAYNGIVNLFPKPVEILPSKTIQTYTPDKMINVCENHGISLEQRGFVVGSAGPQYLPAKASDEAIISIPSMDPRISALSSSCKYNGMDCQTYAESFGCIKGEADLEFNIRKDDIACHDVSQVEVIIDGKKEVIALEDAYTCSNREFCQGDVWTLKKKKYVNSCKNEGGVQPLIYDPIDMTFYFKTVPEILRPVKFLITIDGQDPQKPDPSPTPAPTVAVTKPPPQTIVDEGAECVKDSIMLYFRVSSRACSASQNGQQRLLRHNSGDKKKKSKFSCTESSSDFGSCTGDLFINGKRYSQEAVFSVSDPSNDEEVTVSCDDSTQTIAFHTSCSVEFEIGHTFGALQLVGFETKEEELVGVNN